MRSQIPMKFIYNSMVKVFMKLIFFLIRYLSLPERKCVLRDKNKSVETFYHIIVELNKLNGQQTKINGLMTIFEEILYFLQKTSFVPSRTFS